MRVLPTLDIYKLKKYHEGLEKNEDIIFLRLIAAACAHSLKIPPIFI